MKKAAVVMAVMVLALALSQSAMAAPTQGFATAAEHSNSDNLLGRLLGIFGAIWGGGSGGHNGAIWGPGGGGGNNGAIWGGGPGGGGNNGAIWGGESGVNTDGAIWGGNGNTCPRC